MADTQIIDRQHVLERIVTEALENPSLMEALEMYRMGQKEYMRAVAGSVSIKIMTGDASNPSEKLNANLDRD